MRNFRTAAVASATALTVAFGGVAVASAETTETPATPEASYEKPADRPRSETKDKDNSVAFKGFSQEGDKSFNDSIKDGSSKDGSSGYVDDEDKPFYGVDAFGKKKNADALPQWARIWIDGTIVSAIGALVGLVIAGVNFASYNGLIKL
ncbi:hypothetical protein [Corynebacterium hadale]|uniref:hypothetical protein n=1 Tax=Corynebacterium hadale TaxID=2026255 RepID=UPI000BAA8698|nr:hypothetical protein [Corynebacterium hadale]PAT13394.1 hypothetical protein CKJ83_00670 [Corynebacterium hadale]